MYMSECAPLAHRELACTLVTVGNRLWMITAIGVYEENATGTDSDNYHFNQVL